jgi:short-subunit dehydrogenase
LNENYKDYWKQQKKNFLKCKKLCITGATGGLGLSLCRLFAKKGIAILAIARDKEKLLLLKKELSSQTEITILPSDLTQNLKETANAIKEFNADGLINNAGVGYYGPFHTLNQKEIETTLCLKITTITTLLHELIPFWIEKKTPAIIMNIASANAFINYPYYATYSSANSFLLQFSLALHTELKPYNISSLCFCPGSIKTNFSNKASLGRYSKEPPLSIPTEKCALAIFHQMVKQKPYLLYNYRYYFLIMMTKLLPLQIQGKLLMKTIISRLPNRP